VIAAAGVGWRIGGARILEDITLEVGVGELLGIIGPNGAGKSSLVNILSGVTRPSDGRVTLGEDDVTRLSATKRARRGLARSFQTSALFDGLSARENVRLAIQAAGPAPFSPFRAAGIVGGDRIDDLLARVRMPGKGQTLARDLSHGDRRKLELAMALASDPKVLLLDEPMAGVSAEDVDGLTEIIGDVRDSGVSVAMVEHHMHVVLGLADRVAVLHHGQLLAVGSPTEVTSDERVQQAYLGEAL
jgi:branched-chain amino acid transport system ATP-binding protein